ncbi:unnamed protein product [Symbiodinium sp. CCMP2592]|nr:unnamed protein product [Symbiodinium sp. CCMP2592]
MPKKKCWSINKSKSKKQVSCRPDISAVLTEAGHDVFVTSTGKLPRSWRNVLCDEHHEFWRQLNSGAMLTTFSAYSCVHRALARVPVHYTRLSPDAAGAQPKC